ncbi:hypothetical protein IQ07DRAFT_153188 [Pyrenochaeta sp. DS3sAY3a]|nr:hypothetical protein IQ07DRAFT_153188 [Pyrenochaeta sp. DS3sAY3a]
MLSWSCLMAAWSRFRVRFRDRSDATGEHRETIDCLRRLDSCEKEGRRGTECDAFLTCSPHDVGTWSHGEIEMMKDSLVVVQPCESTTRLDEPHESHSGTTRLRLRWRTRRLASPALAFGKATRRSPRRRAMLRPRRPAWKYIFQSRRHSMFRAARSRRKILFPGGSEARRKILADLRRARPGDIRSNNTSPDSTSLGICISCAILYSAGPADS